MALSRDQQTLNQKLPEIYFSFVGTSQNNSSKYLGTVANVTATCDEDVKIESTEIQRQNLRNGCSIRAHLWLKMLDYV